jgi:DNA polymerase epsilon subunit 2
VNNQRAIVANASAKIELFLQRYRIIYQRTLRHELFSPCSLSESAHSTNGKKKFQLKPIEFLLSSTKQLEDIIVLGMIAQLKENKFYLEDPTGHLPLNLAEAVR